jgi:hypothetical protein
VIRKGRLAAPLVLSILCVLALAAGAGANHSAKDLISIGPSGGNGPVHSFFDASSQDGSHVFFETTESLVSGDTDGGFSDIYDRSAGTTSLVSTGPSDTNGPSDAFFDGASADGTKVFFDTDQQLVPADTDNFIDVYMRSGGTTTLVSTGTSGGNGAFDVTFDGASQDGSRVFFETDEQLVPADTDNTTDIYEHSGGTTTLISTGPSGGNGAFTPVFDGNSADGTHVFFDTDEALVSGDADTQSDVYDRSGGTTTLMSTGPAGGNGAIPARYQGNSASGTRVWFETYEPLVGGDTDTQSDVYERSGGTTTQVSTGPTGGNGPIDAFFDGASQDGTHVYFHTTEQLVAGDTDTRRDVYDRSGGATTQVSTGPAGGNGAIDAFFDGASQNGGHAFFDTTESLVASDTDTHMDVYDRSAGTTTQVSTGSIGGNGAFDSLYEGSSQDGARVFFSTAEPLEPSDGDTSSDVYERFGGATTHISFGPNGGNAVFGAFFDGTTPDGKVVFFNTRESLISTDTDTFRDVYSATVDAYPRPRGATPLRTSFVPAFQACVAANRAHGAPLAFPSCSPPVQASAQLTVGTPDANGAPANSIGSVRVEAILGNPSTPANEADVRVALNFSDVRQKASLADYTGQLQLVANARVTDRFSGPTQGDAATGDVSFPITVPCTATGSTTIGSTCAVVTTFNSVVPGSIVELKRTIWAMQKMDVYDGGPDGVASTTPNTLFATQGVFVP